MSGLVDEHCWCAELPDNLPGVYLTDDVRLASVLEDVVDSDSSTTYRCLVCGQMWQAHYGDQYGFRKI